MRIVYPLALFLHCWSQRVGQIDHVDAQVVLLAQQRRAQAARHAPVQGSLPPCAFLVQWQQHHYALMREVLSVPLRKARQRQHDGPVGFHHDFELHWPVLLLD
jgi:hypothetical protein